MKCEECIFFEPIGDVGGCHRFPPTQDGKGTKSVDEFPVVKPNSWCGEYKKKGSKK